MINWIVKLFVGKNAPSLSRGLAQKLAGMILASALFVGAVPVGPGEIPVPGEVAAHPELSENYSDLALSKESVEDGLTVGEVVRLIIAGLIFFTARVVSYLRAKNLDWVASRFGLIIGRSIPSLFRALLEAGSGVLTFFAIVPGVTPQVLEGMPLGGLGEALIMFLLARISSAIEDGKRNPVAASRRENSIFLS